jgi:hypothetical protein
MWNHWLYFPFEGSCGPGTYHPYKSLFLAGFEPSNLESIGSVEISF